MALYQLTLFYPRLKEHSATVRRIRHDVQSIAGKNWRVLSAGESQEGVWYLTLEYAGDPLSESPRDS